MVTAVFTYGLSDEYRFFVDYLNIRQLVKGDFKPTTVEEVISKIGRTFVILEPAPAPLVLDRTWCVFEMSCTALAGAEFQPILDSAPLHAIFSDEDFYRINSDCLEDAAETIKKLYGDVLTAGLKVCVEECRAREPADKEMVLAHIQKACGLEELNSMVSAMLTPSKIKGKLETLLLAAGDEGSDSDDAEGEEWVKDFRRSLRTCQPACEIG